MSGGLGQNWVTSNILEKSEGEEKLKNCFWMFVYSYNYTAYSRMIPQME
jgi:hypothetical protein